MSLVPSHRVSAIVPQFHKHTHGLSHALSTFFATKSTAEPQVGYQRIGSGQLIGEAEMLLISGGQRNDAHWSELGADDDKKP